MGATHNTRRGRPKRDPLIILDGHTFGIDGARVNPEKRVGDKRSPSFDPKLADQQLFVMEYTRKLVEQMDELAPSQSEQERDDRYGIAMGEAGRELTKRLRSKKALFLHVQGRKAGQLRSDAPGVDVLLREYTIVRPLIRGTGQQCLEIARRLWRRNHASAMHSDPTRLITFRDSCITSKGSTVIALAIAPRP